MLGLDPQESDKKTFEDDEKISEKNIAKLLK